MRSTLYTISKLCCIPGLSEDQAIKFACQMGFGPHCVEPAADIFVKLYNMFIQKDCTLVEINPMTEISTGDGKCHITGKLRFIKATKKR